MDPIGNASLFPSGDKGFSDFQKDGYSFVLLKPQFWFTNDNNNWKELSVGPHRESANAIPSGKKGFRMKEKNAFL